MDPEFQAEEVKEDVLNQVHLSYESMDFWQYDWLVRKKSNRVHNEMMGEEAEGGRGEES